MAKGKPTEGEVAELRRLLKAHDGLLRASDVVEAASDPSSVLHDRFTWDDTEAASRWRDHEARELLRVVRISLTIEDRSFVVPMVVHDPSEEGQCYRSIESVAADPVRARQVLAYTLSVASGHVTRAVDLAEAFGLSTMVREVADRLEEIQERLVELEQQPTA